ncbi:LacI family transcriptional regulator LacR [Companilactobacillus crustorum]|uniref:LacI family transcriptional regulator LacR n=4 Tax=Companilactobacillus TaxID=2767879 RepID=A0A837RJQ9_9LACO|nr:LacI family transcriptional regulator LacR [Companilactobacillus crustorum JCM 15951]KRO20562.1 LacI family transcriptional regulator LacR [Companilactobacillus crustorum]
MFIMSTINDIAKAAGVSNATVSRVLNNDQKLQVSSETRKKIFDVADSLNYTKYKKKIPTAIGTISVIQWYTREQEINDLYYLSIRWGVEKRLRENNYKIKNIFSFEEFDNIKNTDGIVAIGKYSPDQIKQLKSLDVPIVVVDSDTMRYEVSCVTTDFDSSVFKIINHFTKNKHSKIGMIAGQEETTDNQKLYDPREMAFIKYMSISNLFNQNYIFKGPFNIDSGYALMNKAIKKLGRNLPTAFFIASDELAVGAIRALEEQHISIPDRVSIVGFNGSAIDNYLSPSLSTIEVDKQEMGSDAVDLLLKIKDKSLKHSVKLTIGTTLTLRESSKKLS